MWSDDFKARGKYLNCKDKLNNKFHPSFLSTEVYKKIYKN